MHFENYEGEAREDYFGTILGSLRFVGGRLSGNTFASAELGLVLAGLACAGLRWGWLGWAVLGWLGLGLAGLCCDGFGCAAFGLG